MYLLCLLYYVIVNKAITTLSSQIDICLILPYEKLLFKAV